MMVRTADLGTKRATFRAFVGAGSPRVIGAFLAVALALRLSVGRWSPTDLAVVLITAAFVGLVEWCIHLFLLHADDQAWTSRWLGTGRGHRRHHLDPVEFEWVLVPPGDAAIFAVLIAIGTVGWTLVVGLSASWLFGWETLSGPVLTGHVTAFAAFAHYEWTHLLVHTRYRPRTRYYRRLARNHRLHHFRNERYWLGVTSNLGDRVLRTYPADKGDVALSATARALSDSSVATIESER